jgi:inosine/xanthosine triphosphatase
MRLRIAVGSERRPKLEAVRRALARLAALEGSLAEAEVLPCDAGDVAPAMPLSLDALLEGARARAHHALERLAREGVRPELALGLEGGLEVRGAPPERHVFLMSWAYATDGRRGAWGCGGGVELPAPLVAAVVDEGQELGHAIDAFVGAHDVRSGAGAWGVLTRGALDRSHSFEIAVVNALAPFYNAAAFG